MFCSVSCLTRRPLLARWHPYRRVAPEMLLRCLPFFVFAHCLSIDANYTHIRTFRAVEEEEWEWLGLAICQCRR